MDTFVKERANLDIESHRRGSTFSSLHKVLEPYRPAGFVRSVLLLSIPPSLGSLTIGFLDVLDHIEM